jgi:outer membrane protein assembly factor BamB
LRLAVASSRIGDHAAAAASLAAAEAERESALEGLVAEVKKDAAQAKTSSDPLAAGGGEYRMILGGPERRGVMPSLPPELTKANLRELWNIDFEISAPLNTAVATRGRRVRVAPGAAQPQTAATTREALIQRWLANHWSPAGQLLFADGKVFIKTNNDLGCWDVASPDEKPVWRSTWLNEFKVDPQSSMLQMMAQNGAGVSQRPLNQPEVQFFGDRIHQSMSIVGGLVLNIEGERVARYSKSRQLTQQPQQQPGFQFGVTPRRSRKNWLAAYELSTGRAKWRRGADDAAKNDDTEVGFMAAPVPYGNLLLVPVSDGGAMWLYGLSAADGVTAWKTYLCDEPTGGCAPWSPVCVSVAGSDAYVLCGAGVIFSVDAVSGAIRYAVRYTRDGDANPQMAQWGYSGMSLLNLRGFEDDTAIPFGRALIVMASDHDGLFAIDRRSGEVLWRSPRTPFDHAVNYCLGIADGGLFVAGPSVVRRYDAAGGKLVWERSAGDMYGRGALTGDALYMPVKGQVGGAVVKLDLKTGEVLAQAGVVTNNLAGDSAGDSSGDATSETPLGSLFSDGEKLWMLSGHRVSMLADDDYERRVPDQKIDAGDGAARQERSQRLLSQERLDEAGAGLATHDDRRLVPGAVGDVHD